MSGIKFDLEIKFGSKYGKEEEEAVLRVLRNNAPTSGTCSPFTFMDNPVKWMKLWPYQ